MRIVSIINQKGGCGKTTTAINLSASLARLNRRVLLIDLDPQGHASLGLNLKPETLTKGMTEVLTQGAYLDDVICESISPDLDVAPANITLSAAEPLLANAFQKERRLLSAIQAMKRSYDYIVIDSPPSLGLLTFNALRASDEAIVPIEMGFFSLHGLAKLTEIVEVLGRHTGHRVVIYALATMVNLRAQFTREVLAEIQRHFGTRVFKTLIRNNIRLREAVSHGVPVVAYDADSNGAADYAALAGEMIGLEKTDSAVAGAETPAAEIPALEVEKFLGPILVEDVLTNPTRSSILKSGANG